MTDLARERLAAGSAAAHSRHSRNSCYLVRRAAGSADHGIVARCRVGFAQFPLPAARELVGLPRYPAVRPGAVCANHFRKLSASRQALARTC